MISRRGDDRSTAPADVESLETLLDVAETDADTVVDRLRESGPRRHVSEASADDILESISTPQEPGTTGGFGLAGGPRRTVSTVGIDEVFEQLEASVEEADASADPTSADGTGAGPASTADDAEAAADRSSSQLDRSAADFETVEREVESSFGSLAGGGPTRTVADAGVDEILAQVEDESEPVDEPSAERVEPDGQRSTADEREDEAFDWIADEQLDESDGVDPTELAVEPSQADASDGTVRADSWLVPGEDDSVDLRNALSPPPAAARRPDEETASDDSVATAIAESERSTDEERDGTAEPVDPIGDGEATETSLPATDADCVVTEVATASEENEESMTESTTTTYRERTTQAARPLVTREELEAIAAQAPCEWTGEGYHPPPVRASRDDSTTRSSGPVPEIRPAISVDCVRPPTDVADGSTSIDDRAETVPDTATPVNSDADTDSSQRADADTEGSQSADADTTDDQSIWGRARARTSALLDRLRVW